LLGSAQQVCRKKGSGKVYSLALGEAGGEAGRLPLLLLKRETGEAPEFCHWLLVAVVREEDSGESWLWRYQRSWRSLGEFAAFV
jgi:hypothetical protein